MIDPILEKIRKANWPRIAVTWSVNQLLAWLDEVEPIADRRGKFDWLEIPPIASAMAIQEAYHQIARTRHPDLFRARIDHRTLDRLVRMYARVTAAYAELKEPEKCAAYLRELRGPRPVTAPPVSAAPPPAAPATAPAPAPAPSGAFEPSHAMNARALSHYRRAEGCLKTGDRSAAMLQLKMAIAADPKSSFLRAALVELMKS